MDNTSDAQRMTWVDLVKVTCIFLVVLYHARHTAHLIDWSIKDSVAHAWQLLGILVKPLRMPLFFLVSGLVAAPALQRQWKAVAPRKILRFYYVYFLWAGIFLVIIPDWPRLGVDNAAMFAEAGKAAAGISLAWYLWALATFFLIAWVSRKLSWWIPVGLALVIACLAPLTVGLLPVQTTSMLRCAIFFLLGVRLPHLSSMLSSQATAARFTIAVLLYGTAMLFSLRMGQHFNPVVDSFAVSAAVMAATLAVRRWPGLAAVSAWLSQRTLTIYLLHFPMLAVIPFLSWTFPDSLLGNAPFAYFFPLLASLFSIGSCLIIHEVIRITGTAWLFDLPQIARAARIKVRSSASVASQPRS